MDADAAAAAAAEADSTGQLLLLQSSTADAGDYKASIVYYFIALPHNDRLSIDRPHSEAKRSSIL